MNLRKILPFIYLIFIACFSALFFYVRNLVSESTLVYFELVSILTLLIFYFFVIRYEIEHNMKSIEVRFEKTERRFAHEVRELKKSINLLHADVKKMRKK
ncbi:MAG: hypothetical protein PHW96_04560 [Candidatus Nanoarchaeia archaeon]|nr:hypothetical protein [Candidatus Nanoarchaeia archaeon]